MDSLLRLCVDYRENDRQPLPRIDDLFDQLVGASVFFRSSYPSPSAWMAENGIDKTAFRTLDGFF